MLVLVMRHAEAADFRPGRADRDRPLTENGRAQAAAVGAWLAERGVRIDHALVSSALRTRETYAEVAAGRPVEFVDGLYNADPETIRQAIDEAPEGIETLLVVAHNPGVHALAYDLVGAAAPWLSRGFPTASLVAVDWETQELRFARPGH